jgi:hypothetical protein
LSAVIVARRERRLEVLEERVVGQRLGDLARKLFHSSPPFFKSYKAYFRYLTRKKTQDMEVKGGRQRWIVLRANDLGVEGPIQDHAEHDVMWFKEVSRSGRWDCAHSGLMIWLSG